jgi:large subunit ribosomal protein L5
MSESTTQTQPQPKPRYLAEYEQRIRPALIEELKLSNIMQAPRLLKIALNMGIGEGSRDEKVLQAAEADLTLISGQKPRRNRARISVANFKLRKGMPIGCSVTLRGRYMYEFLERLINVAIPRIRDFRGLPNRSFDRLGNYSFGIREHHIFTEVDHQHGAANFGLDVTLVTTAPNEEQCRLLLKLFGMPLRDR